MTTTLADFLSELRTSLEDPGDTITDTFTADGTTTIWKLSSFPLQTASDTVTDNGTTQARGSIYTINYDNGEITFTTAPTNNHTINIQYTKVVWRDARLISAVNAGIRRLYPRIYKIGECYIQLAATKYDYDMTSTTDVPAASSFGDQTLPTDYNPQTARADMLKAQTRVHWYEYRPFGTNQMFTPYEFARRTTPRNVHIDADPAPADTLKAVYTAPFTVLVNSGDVTDVPDEFYMAVVWYAMSVVMEKKEAKRSRSDAYQVMQNTNANPPGTSAQTADDFLARFNDLVNQNAMRPFPMNMRRRLRDWQMSSRF